eukprot:m.127622 g.127622  ORF g.127622 m.127622 type:complete len:656 (+) comp37932_c0_seq18:370-2337(+)
MNQLPGLHAYLPKAETNNVMAGYLKEDGWFLLRPSFSNEGLFSICVTFNGAVKHFRILQDPTSKQYHAAARRFPTISDLLTFYGQSPLKSKNCGVYLGRPIPVDPVLEREHMRAQGIELPVASPLPPTPTRSSEVWSRPLPALPGQISPSTACRPRPLPQVPEQMNQQQSHFMRSGTWSPGSTKRTQPPMKKPQKAKGPLLPGWTEHFSDKYKRPYFHNAGTGETLWKRPAAPEGPTKRQSLKKTAVPENENYVTMVSAEIKSGHQSPPQKKGPDFHSLPSRKGSAQKRLPPVPPVPEPARSSRPVPPVPDPMSQRAPPPLPSGGQSPAIERGPSVNSRAPPPLPEPKVTPSMSMSRAPPPIPERGGGPPPLPEKDNSAPPPLPGRLSKRDVPPPPTPPTPGRSPAPSHWDVPPPVPGRGGDRGPPPLPPPTQDALPPIPKDVNSFAVPPPIPGRGEPVPPPIPREKGTPQMSRVPPPLPPQPSVDESPPPVPQSLPSGRGPPLVPPLVPPPVPTVAIQPAARGSGGTAPPPPPPPLPSPVSPTSAPPPPPPPLPPPIEDSPSPSPARRTSGPERRTTGPEQPAVSNLLDQIKSFGGSGGKLKAMSLRELSNTPTPAQEGDIIAALKNKLSKITSAVQNESDEEFEEMEDEEDWA